jgi:hypothetical protein
MKFFDAIGEMILNEISELEKRSKQTAKMNRIRTTIKIKERELKQAYAALGRYCYRNLRSVLDSELHSVQNDEKSETAEESCLSRKLDNLDKIERELNIALSLLEEEYSKIPPREDEYEEVTIEDVVCTDEEPVIVVTENIAEPEADICCPPVCTEEQTEPEVDLETEIVTEFITEPNTDTETTETNIEEAEAPFADIESGFEDIETAEKFDQLPEIETEPLPEISADPIPVQEWFPSETVETGVENIEESNENEDVEVMEEKQEEKFISEFSENREEFSGNSIAASLEENDFLLFED